MQPDPHQTKTDREWFDVEQEVPESSRELQKTIHRRQCRLDDETTNLWLLRPPKRGESRKPLLKELQGHHNVVDSQPARHEDEQIVLH